MKDNDLKIGVTSSWRNIAPPLPISKIGDMLLANTFEPLIGITNTGSLHPLGAKEWTVSPDGKQIVFKIDTMRKFSDGTRLSSKHYKNSWEQGFLMHNNSKEPSRIEIVREIVGFSNLLEEKTLSGIVTPNDETLVINFIQSRRSIIYDLTQRRYAAWLKLGENWLGTGSYKIELYKDTTDKLLFTRNPFYEQSLKYEKVIVSLIPAQDMVSFIDNGKVHAIIDLQAKRGNWCDVETNKHSCVYGIEIMRIALQLNSIEGSLFSDIRLRQAMQYLVHEAAKESKFPKLIPQDKNAFTPWNQAFLPFSSGVIDESEADSIIMQGKQYLDLLKLQSKEKPVSILSASPFQEFVTYLENQGVLISKDSKVLDFTEVERHFFEKLDYDIIVRSFSALGSDPDSLYIALGKNGGLKSKMINAPSTESLLESGRIITDPNSLHLHYQNVTKNILNEVPYVQLGFIKPTVMYRSDLVDFNEEGMSGREFHFFLNFQ